MKRTLVLAMLLATGAVLATGTASAVDSQNPSDHFLGALKPGGAGGSVGVAGTPNLTWHVLPDRRRELLRLDVCNVHVQPVLRLSRLDRERRREHDHLREHALR